MGKKKPFIDKKTASTFHVVRRSQRDIGGYFDEKTGEPLDMPQEFILMPSPQTQSRMVEQEIHANGPQVHPTTAWDRAKQQLTLAGLVDDYDYDQHTRPISGTGVFISRETGTIASTTRNLHIAPDLISPPSSSTIEMEHSIQEVDRQLDSITLTATCIDEDIAHALFDEYEEGEFEELTDDFCILASQEPSMYDKEQEEDLVGGISSSSQAFDFDAHIAKLLEKAKREDGMYVPDNHVWWEQNQHEFRGVKARYRHQDAILEEEEEDYEIEDEEDEEEDSFQWKTVHQRTDEEEKALCDKFQRTLAEYDDSEAEEEDGYKREGTSYTSTGIYELEGDARLESLLDEYLSEKKDEIFMEGIHKTAQERKRIGGGSSFMVLSGKQMVREEDIRQEDHEPIGNLDDILAEADQVLMDPIMDLPPEEVLIDGKSYFAEKIQSPWDCESILSTYSNLDNNPCIIGRTKKRSSTKKKQVSSNVSIDAGYDDQPIQVILSQKTGLPILHSHIISQTILEDPSVSSCINFGTARRKNESKDEKRLRKEAAKEQKQVSRAQKKLMKSVFQEELAKRCDSNLKNDIGGVSVFRYT